MSWTHIHTVKLHDDKLGQTPGPSLTRSGLALRKYPMIYGRDHDHDHDHDRRHGGASQVAGTGQDRTLTGQDRTGQGRAGQVRAKGLGSTVSLKL
jgi:hypothetical protein